jgi:UDP-GlcNAc:undecaprenyl-phosphate/decaprenyl-phosphate GlcNAc-1-phosphate transferase
MFDIFLALVALSAALLICLNAETIGRRLGVMDHPDNQRKTHAQPTPLVGGMGIILPLLIWLSGVLFSGMTSDTQPLTVLLLCAAGVGLVGFADDQAPISPLTRVLALLVFLGVALEVSPSLVAPSLNWGSFEPTYLPASLYCGLIALTNVGIVNAVNMADGQNGLVPSMFVIWSLCLVLVGDPIVSAVAQILALASFVVLIFNLRGKLFLGDCGSYGVTFVLGVLALMTYAQGRITIETVTVWFYIPVIDCLRLIITRRLQGRSPFAADKDHFHHRLQVKLGEKYGLVAYIVSVAGSAFIAALAPRFALVCLIALTAIYFSFAWLTDSAASLDAEAAEPEDTGRSSLDESFTNVVSLAASEHVQLRERA